MVIQERNRDIGGFTVGRLLPYRKKRMVGPFIYIDHMGPASLSPGEPFDIGQHPHIGLSTLTYLLEGEIWHKDSLGSSQVITPGDVNWMTAGKGVVHTEVTPEHLIGKAYTIHGYQIWVALPLEKEDMEPSFHHIPRNDLPVWQENGLKFTLVAGNALSRTSPVPVHSDLYMLKVVSKEEEGAFSSSHLFGEFGICPVKGAANYQGQRVDPGEMLVVEQTGSNPIGLAPNSLVMIFGGLPYKEKRLIDWNFVSSEKEKIEHAKEKWRDKAFRMIEGESSYIPLPGL